MNRGREIELPVLFPIGKDRPEQPASAGASQKVLLIRRLFIGIPGREHHALDSQVHHLVEKRPHALGVGSVKQRGIGGHPETAFHGLTDPIHCDFIPALAANCEVVVLLLPIQMDAESKVLARLEEVDFLFEQQGVGAQVDVLLASHQPFHDLVDFGVHKRFPARNGNHGRAALIHRTEALLGRELALEHVGGILDLAAAGASQVAAEQRLQHQHQRILLPPGKLLPYDIAGHRPHLRYRNTHA